MARRRYVLYWSHTLHAHYMHTPCYCEINSPHLTHLGPSFLERWGCQATAPASAWEIHHSTGGNTLKTEWEYFRKYKNETEHFRNTRNHKTVFEHSKLYGTMFEWASPQFVCTVLILVTHIPAAGFSLFCGSTLVAPMSKHAEQNTSRGSEEEDCSQVSNVWV